jgi:hypothetical protein
VSRDREAVKSVQWTDLSGERRSGPKAREAGTAAGAKAKAPVTFVTGAFSELFGRVL